VSGLLTVSAALLLGVLAFGCTTPLELGERRYRDGDRLGALEIWRQVEADSLYHEAVQRRTTEVENEFDQLVVRYKKRARYYEGRGRLAESVLNYRLALKLQPADHETLAHVQSLARTLEEHRRKAQAGFDEAFAAGDLATARTHLETLREIAPFDPELQVDDRRLDDALNEAVETLLAEGRRGFTTGRHQKSEKAFREVLVLDPENGAAQGYLAYLTTIRAEEQQGTRPATPTTLPATEREIRAEGYYRNALAAEEDERPYAAIDHNLRALRLDPHHAAAKRHLRALRSQLSPNVPALIEDGRVHYEEEELQSALDAWRRVLLIQPGNEKARDYVARAQRLLENLEQLRSEPEPRVGAR
jgi:tetratricopeptide (TPR) repeat protein